MEIEQVFICCCETYRICRASMDLRAREYAADFERACLDVMHQEGASEQEIHTFRDVFFYGLKMQESMARHGFSRATWYRLQSHVKKYICLQSIQLIKRDLFPLSDYLQKPVCQGDKPQSDMLHRVVNSSEGV